MNDDKEIIKTREKEINDNIVPIEDSPKESFISGLPNWDLEPLYEPIKKGEKK